MAEIAEALAHARARLEDVHDARRQVGKTWLREKVWLAQLEEIQTYAMGVVATARRREPGGMT